MSAPIVVPFNFQPVFQEVRTSDYTIPAGRYALVKCVLADAPYSVVTNANLTLPKHAIGLNGVDLFYGTTTGKISIVNSASTRVMTAPNSGVAFLEGSLDFISGGSVILNNLDGENLFGQTFTVDGSFSASVSFQRSGTIATFQSTPINGNFYLRAKLVPHVNGNGCEFWAKAGDVINITNAKAVITEYYNIS